MTNRISASETARRLEIGQTDTFSFPSSGTLPRRLPEPIDQSYFVRVHTPEDLDIDFLTAAVRALLNDASHPRADPLKQRQCDLLSSRDRGSHVVEEPAQV